MEYRTCSRMPLSISAVGLGGEWLCGKSPDEVKSVIDTALDRGMNYIDIFMPDPEVRTNIGKAIAGKRESIYIQGHLCTVFEDGQYKRTRDPKETKKSFQDLLTRLQTDYIDVGMLHYVDTDEDYAAVFESDIIEYALDLKRKGIIHYLGMSSHNPLTALRAVESGLIDVLMFSINPAYDMEETDTDIYKQMEFTAFSSNSCRINTSRRDLYAACEAAGVGITVMKPFAAGSLLSDALSPFGKALTPAACIAYALERPGVISVLPGLSTPDEVQTAADALTADAKERDYSSVISSCEKVSTAGRCMYCGHCLPCSAHINIPFVAKLTDMALAFEETPESVRGHYEALEADADDCIECGQCGRNCPFGVSGIEIMKRARRVFR